MKVDKAKDIALSILINDGGYGITYDKFIFLFNQQYPELDNKLIHLVIVSLEVNKYIKIDATENDVAKVYLLDKGIQLYANGGFCKKVVQRKTLIRICIYFIVLCIVSILSVNFFLMLLKYAKY